MLGQFSAPLGLKKVKRLLAARVLHLPDPMTMGLYPRVEGYRIGSAAYLHHCSPSSDPQYIFTINAATHTDMQISRQPRIASAAYMEHKCSPKYRSAHF